MSKQTKDQKESVSGTVLSMQPNGAGVVKLDDGRNGYFDRFAVLATEAKKHGKVKELSRIEAKIGKDNGDIIRLIDVAPIHSETPYSKSDKKRLIKKVKKASKRDFSNQKSLGKMTEEEFRDSLFGGFRRFNIKAPLPKVFKSTVSKMPEKESIFPHFDVDVRAPDFSKRRLSGDKK